MKRSRRRELGAIAIAILGVTIANAQQEKQEDYEARFGALRNKVAEQRSQEPEWVQERIEKAAPYITGCSNREPTNPHIGIGLDGVEYFYTDISTSADDQHYCFYMFKPFARELTAEEGRDFSAALMMPSIPHFTAGQLSVAEQKKQSVVGEKHLAELRDVVRDSKASMINSDVAQRSGIRDMGDLSRLIDCSRIPVDELQKKTEASAASQESYLIYNDSYTWFNLDDSIGRCIYVISPIKRGLTSDEARALLLGNHLILGYSDEIKKQNPGIDLEDPRRSYANDDNLKKK